MSCVVRSEPGRGRSHPVTTEEPIWEDLDGSPVVRVPLSGKHGIGRYAILDASDWTWISRLFGAHWMRMITPHDQIGRIVCGKKQALEAARKIGFDVGTGRAPLVSLARLVAGTEYDEKLLRAKNKDPFDLRQCNLEAISGGVVHAFMANLHTPSSDAAEQEDDF